MGSIYNRGTKRRPNWWIKYRELDGTITRAPSEQPTKAQAKEILAAAMARVGAGKVGLKRPKDAPLCSVLIDRWMQSFTNRNADDDRNRIKRYLVPKFGAMRLPDITLALVMQWIDDQRAGVAPAGVRKGGRGRKPKSGPLSEPSIRHNLNALSRFFAWSIERGHATTNPVRMIPVGKRPQQSQKRDVPWLDDDSVVRKLVHGLPEPVNLMFYLGNRSGMRTGEIAGLRLADLDFLSEGTIRVRFNYDGPLKEDKRGEGKMKWVPAPDDATALLEPWLAERRAVGAGPEDLVFPLPGRTPEAIMQHIEARWDIATGRETSKANREVERKKKQNKKPHVAQKLDLTWYQATRHSFVSRNLARGASLDEVSAAIGHSSPVVTRRFYDHFVRKTFSSGLREGLGLASANEGKIVSIAKR